MRTRLAVALIATMSTLALTACGVNSDPLSSDNKGGGSSNFFQLENPDE